MLNLANKISDVYPNLNKTSKLIADVYFKEPRIFLNKNLLKEYNALNSVPDEFLYIVMEMYKYVAEDN